MEMIMKKVLLIVIAYSFLFSCNGDVPRTGTLKGRVSYTGASSMAIDNVIIKLRRTNDDVEEGSWRIENTGDYRFDLPAGEYILELEGNRCKSDDLIAPNNRVLIVAGETRPKDINIEQLPYSIVISRGERELQEELQDGSTVTLDNADVLNVWNKYSSNTLRWKISAYPQPSWIIFEQSTGTINGGGSRPIVYSIDKSKMPQYGINSSDIILTAIEENEGRGYKITVQAEKEGGEPGKAVITGHDTNVYPDKSVILTADAPEATSYRWYMGNSLQSGVTGDTFEAKYNGIYYVVGVNSRGEGIKSDGKTVTIISLPNPPAKATISGNSTNNCLRDGRQVTLTANATGATSYIWRKGTEQFNETGNTLVVHETGTYYATGVNTSGTGDESVGKPVTISSCIPANPTNIKVEKFITRKSEILFSWSDVLSAAQYKIQVCDNPSMIGCENNYYTTTDNYRYFTPSELPCGQKYFRIIAANRFGESTGTPYSYTMPVSITAPYKLSLSYNYSTQAWMLDYIDANVEWYEGTIYFEIQRKEDVGPWEKIATIEGHTNDILTTWHSYEDYTYSRDAEVLEYRVRAYIKTSCGIFEAYAY